MVAASFDSFAAPRLSLTGNELTFIVQNGQLCCTTLSVVAGAPAVATSRASAIVALLGLLPLIAPAAGGFWNNNGVVTIAPGPGLTATLPTSKPGQAGVFWLDGGVLTQTGALPGALATLTDPLGQPITDPSGDPLLVLT